MTTTVFTPTMRAIHQDRLGGPDVLRLVELPRPEPGPGEVLVRVHAAGLNPVDRVARETGAFTGPPPFVPGWDVSGVVERTGPGVTRFRAGDEVFGMPRFPRPGGAYAEYVAAPARHLAAKPARLDHVQAAALPLAGLTAWQALVDTAGVRPRARVLVHAAAGGVGHLAIQIARSRGAQVIGTARARAHALLRGLGAHELVDHTAVDVADELAGDVDIVLDAVGGDGARRLLRTLRPGGVLVSLRIRDPGWTAATVPPRVRAEAMLVEPDRYGLESIAELAARGALRPHVTAVLPLAELGAAQERLAAGPTVGKIVLAVADT